MNRFFRAKSILSSAFLVLLFGGIFTNWLQAGNAISGAFELTICRGDDTDISSGLFFFSIDKVLKVKVTSPLEQWMFFEGDTLSIYYPNENNGLKIPSIRGEVSLPIFQLAVNASDNEYKMTEAGYKLTSTQVVGDSIIAKWSPPEVARSVFGDITSIYIVDSLMSITGANGDGDTIMIQIYSHWNVHNGRMFPSRVQTVNSASNIIVKESIVFENVIMGNELPKEAEKLAVPADANITTIDW